MASFIRVFNGLSEFGRFIEGAAVRAVATQEAATALAAAVVYKRVRSIFGDNTKLADLAPATQEDRVAKGYSPNDPLLRDGSLLRDSVEKEHGENWAGVGSAEPIMRYHELGYFNVRAGRAVPPRPVFKTALQESEADIAAITDDAIAVTLGGSSALSLPILEDE